MHDYELFSFATGKDELEYDALGVRRQSEKRNGLPPRFAQLTILTFLLNGRWKCKMGLWKESFIRPCLEWFSAVVTLMIGWPSFCGSVPWYRPSSRCCSMTRVLIGV